MDAVILLPLLLFPIIINELLIRQKKTPQALALAMGPLGLMSLTAWVFFEQAPLRALGLRYDVLSGLISLTVMIIGISVMTYSVRYLHDDPQQKRFCRNLSLALTSVLFMLSSSNLLLFWFCWIVTSYFLHQLLLHYPDRPGAKLGARQKFKVSRLGDAFILIACVCLYDVYGSLDFEVIAQKSGLPLPNLVSSWLVSCAGFFLVLGAMTKSAQYPFHYWLPKTLETPTPVSALMHAGIINAGGILVVRLSGFLEHVPLSLHLLASVGGVTAIYGSLVMLSQTSVKKFLAYSTIAQMGFMMLQCGLGCFNVAVMHIIGHAFYKAHSFLNSASAVEMGRLNRYLPRAFQDPPKWQSALAAVVAVSFCVGMGPWVGYSSTNPGAIVMSVVLGLAMAQMYISYSTKWRALLGAAGLWVFYIMLYHGVSYLLGGDKFSSPWTGSLSQNLVCGLVAIAFICLYFVQNNLISISRTVTGQKLYVRTLNGGFYGK